MLIKSPQLIFILSLMLGTILACSSSSWLMAWIGLEINLMSFIPLLIKNLNPMTVELAIKYFLVQAMASMLIIFITMICMLSIPTNMLLENTSLLSMALAMKAGVAPLHFWFPQAMAYTNWPQALIMLTWQKIAPLILLSFSYNFTIPIFIASSAIIGMLGGLNQTSFKKILTYSSIIHSSWLISISFLSDSAWWTYFFAYSVMTISIITPLSQMNVSLINNMNLLKLNFKTKLLVFINILSLAGLPPFLGFFIKMVAINLMFSWKISILLIMTLIMSSLVAFYFYSRLMYSTFLMAESRNKLFNITPQLQTFLSSTLMFSLIGNLFISLLVLLV